MALEILQILASGTFGHVVLVRDGASGGLLAAKVLKDEHIENPKVLSRMRDEAALLQRLSHPHIVRIEGVREVAGRPVLLLEYIRGVPLDALLVKFESGLPPGDACEIVRLASLALHHASRTVDPLTHQPLRVIHRDLKPANVLLSDQGDLKMLDFGIAKGEFDGKESETVSAVLGAHGYLAPERLDGADDDPKGDVYAMGCVLFELLTARRIQLSLHPRAHVERLQRELMRIRPPGASAWVVHELTNLVSSMVAYEADDRPDHAAVADRLGRIVASSGYLPDLERLGRKHVGPLLDARSFETPSRHPAWEEVRFLETPTGGTPATAPPRESDLRIRDFLAEDGWHQRLPELRRLLARDPSWTARPFLDHLHRLEAGPFWRRWVGDRDARDQLVAMLEFLRSRPGPEVVDRVRPLLKHRDAEVAALARLITD